MEAVISHIHQILLVKVANGIPLSDEEITFYNRHLAYLSEVMLRDTLKVEREIEDYKNGLTTPSGECSCENTES